MSAPTDGENIVGTSGDDRLTGTDGDDTINGLSGDDTITGGAGDDSLIGGGGHDWITDDSGGADSLYGGGDNDGLYLYRYFVAPPADAEHVLLDGGDGDDSLYLDTSAGDGIDYAMDATVLGGVGDDYLDIGTVQKVSVDAGAGDDDILTYIGDSRTLTLGAGKDVLELEGLQGAPTAMVITDFKTGDGGDRLSMRYMLLADTLQGWDRDNPFGEGYLRLLQRGSDTVMQIDADGGGDVWSDLVVFQHTHKAAFTAFNLDGYPLNGDEPAGELLTGTEGDDTLYGTNGADTLVGLGGNDWLFSGVSDDSLSGGEGDDLLSGDGGKDTLDGGDGNDSLSAEGRSSLLGGDGNDLLNIYLNQTEGVATLDAGAGDDQLSVNFTSFLAPTGQAMVSGGDGDDVFTVDGTGRATLDGGAGDDQFELAGPSSQLVLTLGDGRDLVKVDDAAVGDTAVMITDFAAGAAGDQLELYDFLKEHLIGWDFSSNPFADDYLRLVAQGKSTLVQWSAAGDGTWSNLFLFKGVAPASLTQENLGGYPSDGSEPIGTLIKGSRADDTLTSGNGPDTVNGGKGFDHLYGGAGDDNLIAGGGNDTLYGGFGADVMDGGGGDDLLDGSDGGADTLTGGTGDDDLAMHRNGAVPPATGLIVLQGGEGDDYITYGADQLNQDQVSVDGGVGDDWINFESAVGAATVQGGDGDDVITTGFGPMSIDAGSGDDLINVSIGGLGAGITLGAGADLLNLSGSVLYLSIFASDPIEVADFASNDRLELQRLDFGGDLDPFNDGHLRLAQVGADAIMQGLAENGEWIGVLQLDGVTAGQLTSNQLGGYQAGPVWLIGTDADDDLALRKGFTHIDADDGDDTVTGSAVADTIIGGHGGDVLTGRGGGDVFQYNSLADSAPDAADRITDLTNVDQIDLSRIDADVSTFGDQAFHLVSAFTGQAGELTLSYDAGTRLTTLSGDVDGDGAADLVITVDQDHHSFSHFVL